MKTKSETKRLVLLRDFYIKQREQKINEYEEKTLAGETFGLPQLAEEINSLGAKINDIDEKIGV